MRKSIFLLLAISAVILCACGDLVLFKQKIEGRDPLSLEGSYVLEIESDNKIVYDTLQIRRVLPYRFIIHSAQVERDSLSYEVGDPRRRGELYQGEIHQMGDDYFVQYQDEQTGKWQIGAFRIRNGHAYFILETLYLDMFNDALVQLVSSGKLKVEKKSERTRADGGEGEDSKYKVYEVGSSPGKIKRMWRRLLRRADKLPIKKLNETSPSEKFEDSDLSGTDGGLLYPNPSSGIVHIEMPTQGNWKAEIFDLNGKRLQSLGFLGNALTWDLSELASGTYFLKVSEQESGEARTFRMVKGLD